MVRRSDGSIADGVDGGGDAGEGFVPEAGIDSDDDPVTGAVGLVGDIEIAEVGGRGGTDGAEIGDAVADGEGFCGIADGVVPGLGQLGDEICGFGVGPGGSAGERALDGVFAKGRDQEAGFVAPDGGELGELLDGGKTVGKLGGVLEEECLIAELGEGNSAIGVEDVVGEGAEAIGDGVGDGGPVGDGGVVIRIFSVDDDVEGFVFLEAVDVFEIVVEEPGLVREELVLAAGDSEPVEGSAGAGGDGEGDDTQRDPGMGDDREDGDENPALKKTHVRSCRQASIARLARPETVAQAEPGMRWTSSRTSSMAVRNQSMSSCVATMGGRNLMTSV